MSIIPSAAVKQFRILLVDNDDPFRQILKTTLRVSLPTVAIDEAAGGGEALQKAI
jgi:CheY-like chemotaxis protein